MVSRTSTQIYSDPSVDPAKWSISQLVNVQREPAMQMIHEDSVPQMAPMTKWFMEKFGVWTMFLTQMPG
ncbi:hypothetical protein P8609_10960 [Lysobacter sp. UC]|uniref:Uncharacterized protein n=1 Tax=Lysobacter arvi TaxID=3038776 RepID=A0ABU1CEK3_9GAMM|nr:hypothetical protein [Lysobacter arvi]